MSDPPVPLAVFQPVAGEQLTTEETRRRPAAHVSSQENARRALATTKRRAQAGSPAQAGSGKTKGLPPRLSYDEIHGMLADIARGSYQQATDEAETANARKNHSVAVAVVVDKFIAVEDRLAKRAADRQRQVPTDAALVLTARLLGTAL